MKKWLLLLTPLFCVACSDSAPPDSSAAAVPAPETTQVATPVTSAEQDAVEQETEAAEQDTEAAAESRVVTEEVEYRVGDETFTGFLAYDAAVEGERPGVLVVHEWWGHNDYVRSRAVEVAELGYTALALDMYGSGKVADHPAEAQQFMEAALADPELMGERFLAAKQLLEQQSATDADRIAAIGYCFGGAVVLNMARAGVELDGVASFHGVLATEQPATPDTVAAKVLVLHGEADPLVPPEQVDAFKAEMDAAGVDYEFIGYPGVQHSFTNPGATEVGEQFDMPLEYDEEADRHSWEALQAFFESLWGSTDE